jgi:DNA-directed RNA polymerase subunit RPC12/RpoP
MKEIKIICPKCSNVIVYKNWFSWICHTPFHNFGKRRTVCHRCGNKFYANRKSKN